MMIGEGNHQSLRPERAGFHAGFCHSRWRYCHINGSGLKAVEQLFRPGLHAIELHVGISGQIIRERKSEVSGHQGRAIANGQTTLFTIADSPCCRLEIIDIRDDPAGLLDEHTPILCRLSATGGALEELDA